MRRATFRLIPWQVTAPLEASVPLSVKWSALSEGVVVGRARICLCPSREKGTVSISVSWGYLGELVSNRPYPRGGRQKVTKFP